MSARAADRTDAVGSAAGVVVAAASTAWDAVIGQAAAAAALRSAVAADEVPHALLVVGPPGVGQEALVRAFAAALDCLDAPVPGEACGACDACGRIARGVHPALERFEPDGAAHLVDDVRGAWIPAAMRSLPEARRKVLVIAAADRMNEAAQNAFLKVLEEPPASVVWVLEAEDDARLLDTVLSRCRRLDLAPWGPDELVRHARELGIAEADAVVVARASMGSPQRVADLADPDVAEARQRHLAIVGELAEAGPGAVVPLARELAAWAKARGGPLAERNAAELERLEEAFGVEAGRGWPPGVKQRIVKRFERAERAEQRRALTIVLDDLASWARDLIALGAGADADVVINLDRLDDLARDRQLVDPAAAIGMLEAIGRCRAALERNGAVELHLERLLMAIAVPLFARRLRAA